MRWRNATYAFVDNLRELLGRGSRISVRDQDTRELRNCQIDLQYPLERCIVTPRRNNNIFATVAETMWVLAGRNDIDFLAPYLPRAHEFSDDGRTWRAGYGPRLRNWHGVDQLSTVVRLLQAEPNTRRAVMSIFDPAEDFVESKDIPCNNWIHCYIRDGALHINIAVRSNDIMWGFSGINTFEWSVIQEMLAHWTRVPVGSVTFFISSLHLYSRHEQRAPEIVRRFPNLTCYEAGIAAARFETEFSEINDALRDWFALEELARRDPDRSRVAIDSYPDPLFRSFLTLLRIYAGAPRWPDELLSQELAALPETDLSLAAYEYFNRERGDVPAPQATKQPLLTGYWSVLTGAASPLPVHMGERLRTAISSLHAEKSAAYGDSWKRRGEILGIAANLARKVDRLERSLTVDVNTQDESLLDTGIDLFVYAIKYVAFLADLDKNIARCVFGDVTQTSPFSDGTGGFDSLLSQMDFHGALHSTISVHQSIRNVLSCFAEVEQGLTSTTTMERAVRAKRLAQSALLAVGALTQAASAETRSAFLSRGQMRHGI